MVQCAFCLNYDGFSCIEPAGVCYGRAIEDETADIVCPAYLERGVAGLAGMAMALGQDMDDFLAGLL
jgi:hypothetical protein